MKLFFSTKNYTILLVTICLIFLLSVIKGCQIYSAIQASKGRGAPPATVNTYIVSSANWPRTFSAVGSLRAAQGAILSTEDAGRIAAIHFESGQQIEAGQVLVELDTEVEKAQLLAAKASLRLVDITAQRERNLRAQNANSQADLDIAEAELSLAKAEINRIEALIKRRQIVSPFPGITGVRQVDVGEFVNLGTQIVDVNSFDKFFLDFYLPQNQIKEYQLGDIVEVRVRGVDGQVFIGNLTGVNSQIDPVSRNILLQATVHNVDELLRPGMFVDVDLIKAQPQQVLIVPISSISYAPYGNSVYSIQKNQSEPPYDLLSHTVTLGRKKGDFVEVLSGIKAGEEIVASGIFKLFPGVKVFINNDIQPLLSENPQVENS